MIYLIIFYILDRSSRDRNPTAPARSLSRSASTITIPQRQCDRDGDPAVDRRSYPSSKVVAASPLPCRYIARCSNITRACQCRVRFRQNGSVFKTLMQTPLHLNHEAYCHLQWRYLFDEGILNPAKSISQYYLHEQTSFSLSQEKPSQKEYIFEI